MEARFSVPVLCGQLIVGGFDGESLSPRFAKALRAGKRGGAILFKRNLPTVEHARQLTREIIDTARPDLPPFVALDEEGGRVSRLKSPVVRLPPMRRLAERSDAAFLESVGRVLGMQLAACGFNLDFAPVLDVDTNPANPVIGDRSFAADAEAVSMAALAFYQGLSRSVLGCGKHFPGHGDTSTDSHFDLPTIEHGMDRLRQVELVPFVAAARANVDAIMTAHILVRAIDPHVPATLSRAICTDLLRRDIGFQGVLFSDDLEMKAVADRFPIEDSAVLAIEAGCDVLLVCRDEDAQERALDALVHRAESDPAFLERCSEAVRRGLNARKRRVARPLDDEAELRRVFAMSREIEQRIEEKLAS